MKNRSIPANIVVIMLVLVLNCITITTQAQNGFTHKAEAKNAMKKGLREGKWLEYIDSNGVITTAIDEAYYYMLSVYKGGDLAEIVRVFFMNGVLEGEVPYSDGKANGLEKVYYENGTIKEESPYRNDQINGVQKCYYTTGKLKSETIYSNGIAGKTKTYDENGNPLP